MEGQCPKTTVLSFKNQWFADAKSGTSKTLIILGKTKVLTVAKIPSKNLVKTKLKSVENGPKVQNTTEFCFEN